MKSSFKISVLLTMLVIIARHANAQSHAETPDAKQSVIFSVGPDAGYSTGSFKNYYKWNIGGSLQADIPVVKNVFLNVDAGYNNFFGRNDIAGGTYSPSDIHLLPVKAGIKYFPISCFYVQGDAGAAFVLNKNATGFGKTTSFIYAPQIGLQYPLRNQNYIDAGVYYESSARFTEGVSNSKISMFGLRIAYAFAIGK